MTAGSCRRQRLVQQLGLLAVHDVDAVASSQVRGGDARPRLELLVAVDRAADRAGRRRAARSTSCRLP